MRRVKHYVGAMAVLLLVQPLVLGTTQPAYRGHARMHKSTREFLYPYLVSSMGGPYGLKYLWNTKDYDGPPTCILFELLKDGRERTIWKHTLINIPIRITMEDTVFDPYIFTLGTRRITSDKHFLVIYDDHGKVVTDLKLTDLLTTSEFNALPPDQDPFDWMDAAKYELNSNHGQYLSISLKSGRRLKISLVTGKIE